MHQTTLNTDPLRRSSIARYLANILLLFLPPTRLFRLRTRLLHLAMVNIDISARFCGHGWIYGQGSLNIGKRTWLSPGVVIYTHPNAEIIIGDNCDIGPGVKLITGTHAYGGEDRRAGKGLALPITIGDGCWVGAGVTILGGVTIGKGTVVAAGSVVTKNVPENVLSAGIPSSQKKILPNTIS